ncbi:uncharacterized protein LOC117913958 [Vitis riparia]|uniref:uncharacterized protein LOC117913958 n=1 Tax=Vitis riparia TaxID=96939 RepID=UPI00155A76C2|nr:uncharacterized protein LOC117913958 [Vitis riparia]
MNMRKKILRLIVKVFLNDWLLRVFILVSLFSQIQLLLLGNRRKYTPGNWLRSIIWQAYATKDAIIDISIGALFKWQGTSEDNSSQQNDLIKAFWLPFLLQHLGGPDTITAYSLEDNELWKRQFIQLLLKFVWASSIFLRSWKSRPLNIITIPMFVTGLIKYGEKTWFLRSASSNHFRKTKIRHEENSDTETIHTEPRDEESSDEEPSCACECYAAFMAEYDGVSYAAFMTGCDCKKAEVENTPSPDPRNESILVAAPLQKAIEFFPKFKRLFTDVVLKPTYLEQSKSFFNNISWKQAFEVIEIELGFIYDIFYTKPMKVSDEWGLVRRFICLFSEISTFIGFMKIDGHECSTTDVIITWLLLVGAIVEEIYSIILLCSSDRTMNWLNKQGKTRVTRICKAISSCRLPYLFPANKRWSDSMARYNLISYSLKNLPIKFSEVWKFFCIPRMLDECSSKNSDVPKYLKKLIFEQLQEKSRHAPGIKEAKELCADRGKRTLEEMKCFCTLRWSIEGEFDACILLWHVATDLCYYTDLNKKSSPTENSNREASKLLSDYMVYLLVKHPVMLPDGIGQIRFQDSCAKATEIFKCVKDRIQACERLLLQVNTEIPPLKVKGERSKSVLSDACRLAKSLQSLEKKEEWNCEKKWEMMSRVWVEMLCYASCHCPPNRHAEELKNGGELLTHVWLLMAHFGITEHVYLD